MALNPSNSSNLEQLALKGLKWNLQTSSNVLDQLTRSYLHVHLTLAQRIDSLIYVED